MPTYVLSKLKRTISTQKVADAGDIDGVDGVGLEISGGELRIKLDGSTLEVGSDGLKLHGDVPRYQGEWVSGTSYIVGDIVTRSNDVQQCRTANSDASFTQSKWHNLTEDPPAGRTALFTPSGTAGEWTSAINTTPLQVTVQDIDDYEYITIAVWAGQDDTPKFCYLVTILRSEIPNDSTPSGTETNPAIRLSGSSQSLFVGRNSAGTTLYFQASSATEDTGKIMGIWGGDF